MSDDVQLYLRDMYDQTVFLAQKFKDISMDEFFADSLYQYACTRALEIIGEAVKNIPAEFREKYPQISWRSMAGMRDKMIHCYAGVDVKMLWRTLVEDIPKLHEGLAVILNLGDQYPR